MPAASLLLELTRSDLNGLAGTAAASITDVKQLSSYSWIEADSPTIAIPGCPPAWSNIKTPRRLAQDRGHFYISQNQARHPSSPLEPLFRSIYQTEPSFDIRSIDIVSDRNNFRKLLSFVDPSSSPHGADSFAIKVEVVGDTALFKRDEVVAEETIGPHEFRGFGHSFEKAYTHNEIRNSTGHHRIISYQFGDLGIIIRHETDAYVKSEALVIVPETVPGEDLSQMISQLTLSTAESASSQSRPAGSVMTLTTQGRLVPLQATMEIKTRSHRKPLTIRDVAPQLWISQTPKLVRSHHDRGSFPIPRVEDVSGEIRQWEKDQQSKLKILAGVIRKIRDITKQSNGCKAIVRFDKKSDKLTLSACGDTDMLPQDLYRMWDAHHERKQGEEIEVKSNLDAQKKLDDKSTGSSSKKPLL